MENPALWKPSPIESWPYGKPSPMEAWPYGSPALRNAAPARAARPTAGPAPPSAARGTPSHRGAGELQLSLQAEAAGVVTRCGCPVLSLSPFCRCHLLSRRATARSASPAFPPVLWGDGTAHGRAGALGALWRRGRGRRLRTGRAPRQTREEPGKTQEKPGGTGKNRENLRKHRERPGTAAEPLPCPAAQPHLSPPCR